MAQAAVVVDVDGAVAVERLEQQPDRSLVVLRGLDRVLHPTATRQVADSIAVGREVPRATRFRPETCAPRARRYSASGWRTPNSPVSPTPPDRSSASAPEGK